VAGVLCWKTGHVVVSIICRNASDASTADVLATLWFVNICEIMSYTGRLLRRYWKYWEISHGKRIRSFKIVSKTIILVKGYTHSCVWKIVKWHRRLKNKSKTQLACSPPSVSTHQTVNYRKCIISLRERTQTCIPTPIED